LDDWLVKKIRKIVRVNIGAQDHVAAAAAIAAIRAAPRHKFLAPETDAAPPAVPGLGKNFYSIDKHLGNRGNLWGSAPQDAIVSPACHPERSEAQSRDLVVETVLATSRDPSTSLRMTRFLMPFCQYLFVKPLRFPRDFRPGEFLL